MKKILLLGVLLSSNLFAAYPACTNDIIGQSGTIYCYDVMISSDSGTAGAFTVPGTKNWCQGGGIFAYGNQVCHF